MDDIVKLKKIRNRKWFMTKGKIKKELEGGDEIWYCASRHSNNHKNTKTNVFKSQSITFGKLYLLFQKKKSAISVAVKANWKMCGLRCKLTNSRYRKFEINFDDRSSIINVLNMSADKQHVLPLVRFFYLINKFKFLTKQNRKRDNNRTWKDVVKIIYNITQLMRTKIHGTFQLYSIFISR